MSDHLAISCTVSMIAEPDVPKSVNGSAWKPLRERADTANRKVLS